MEPTSRHQCLVYEGPPSRHLPALAAAIGKKLEQNFRCLYLNSSPMVAGIRSYLAATGLDVARETAKTSLVLVSEQDHLVDGSFDIDGMMRTLENALDQALNDGYRGLWATGDMTWEFGPEKNFTKLLEYEWRLEEFFCKHPEMAGICQYHAETLPPDVLRRGLVAHASIFINETLSLFNPHYLSRESFRQQAMGNPEIENAVYRLCYLEGLN